MESFLKILYRIFVRNTTQDFLTIVHAILCTILPWIFLEIEHRTFLRILHRIVFMIYHRYFLRIPHRIFLEFHIEFHENSTCNFRKILHTIFWRFYVELHCNYVYRAFSRSTQLLCPSRSRLLDFFSRARALFPFAAREHPNLEHLEARNGKYTRKQKEMGEARV